jgi:4-aminobutyrate aminotransferase-like enzyme
VLKIKPPIIFSKENAKDLVDALDEVLTAIYADKALPKVSN